MANAQGDEAVQLPTSKYRLLVAIRYLNASEAIFNGLKAQQGKNDFHFLVTIRSFIEYSRRGIWFLVWAMDSDLEIAEQLTFDRAGSPSLVKMDKMINDALGKGHISHLLAPVPLINNEPFLNSLHALTHGNPISVRMFGFGLDKIFQTEGMLLRAEVELNWFRVLLYRRMLGDDFCDIWKRLMPIHNEPENMRAAAIEAGRELHSAGLVASPEAFQKAK
ncbi:MAG TPA: hypothetical protein VNE63_13620 [Candidatus Acidoferrales bacterium]|nr:hypothetical protein [Candidatus Acidoferrales bacterium]